MLAAGSPPKIQGGDVLVFQMEILEIKGDKVEALKCQAAVSRASARPVPLGAESEV